MQVPQGFAGFCPSRAWIGSTHSQSRRATNCATPGYSVYLSGWSYSPKSSAIPTSLHPDIHFPAMIPRRGVKIKFFLSVVIYVVKAAFVPLSAIGENPANAGVARLCGVSQCPVPDTATALPNHAFYQLNYRRMYYTSCEKYRQVRCRERQRTYLIRFLACLQE